MSISTVESAGEVARGTEVPTSSLQVPSSPNEVVKRILDQAYAALVAASDFPTLPQELTLDFLKGVSPDALSPEERDALALSYAAELRLTGLLDQIGTGASSLRARSLVRGQAYFNLTGRTSGHKSFSDVMGQASGKGARAAFRELRTAQVLESTPVAQEAVDQGLMTMDHADVLAKARATANRSGGHELSEREETLLVGMAKSRTADQFSKDADRFMAGRNPLAHDASHEEIKARRYFHISAGPKGASFRGFIDPISAETLLTALAAASSRPSPGDTRTPEQRRADAFIDVVKAPIKAGAFKSGAHVRPHVSVILPELTLGLATKELKRREIVAEYERQVTEYERQVTEYERQVAEYEQQSAQQVLVSTIHGHTDVAGDLGLDFGTVAQSGAGNTPASAPPTAPAPLDPIHFDPIAMDPAEFESGVAIPLNELAQILCDCAVTRVALDADSLPMDLGRTERVYTKEHYRAVVARDKTCRFSGCETASHLSEIHHIKWWGRDNGVTSVENGVLVCRYHHGLIHSGTLEVVKDEHGRPHVVPVGQQIPHQPSSLKLATSRPLGSEKVAVLFPPDSEKAAAAAASNPLADKTSLAPTPQLPGLLTLPVPVPVPVPVELTSDVPGMTLPKTENPTSTPLMAGRNARSTPGQPNPSEDTGVSSIASADSYRPKYLLSPNVKVFRDSSEFMPADYSAPSNARGSSSLNAGHQVHDRARGGAGKRVGRLNNKSGPSLAVEKSFDLFVSGKRPSR